MEVHVHFLQLKSEITTARTPSCGKVLFLHLTVILFIKGEGGLCPGCLYTGGICPGGLCLGVSVQGGLYPGGLCPGEVSVQGESLSRGVSVWGVSVQEGSLSVGSLSERPHTPYGNEQVVRIPLECILVLVVSR